MKRLLRQPSAYLALPMLLACATTLVTFDLPDGYSAGLLLLSLAAASLILADRLIGTRLPDFATFHAREYAGTREAFVALAFAWVVVAFCALDLVLFPIPLIGDPKAYATMEGGREHVRHVSNMCWTLPPIGLLCATSRRLRYALILIGLVFPVLVIDRNRVFAGLFSFGLVLVMRRDPQRALPWRSMALLALGGVSVFSVLGMLRSGALNATLPFSAFYDAMPLGVRWLLVYAGAGPYNFTAMLAKEYVNPDFLVNQLVPFAGSIATAGTDIPLDAYNINVGTEFFPFLLAAGPIGALAAIYALYAMLLWSVRLLRSGSLFALLIFLRMAYVCAMSPFAPQAYTLMNFAFIALCLLMQLGAALLPLRPSRTLRETFP